MAEQKAEQKPKGYFVGELRQPTAQGDLMVSVVAKPDGTPMNELQVQVEILNKLDAIATLIKERL